MSNQQKKLLIGLGITVIVGVTMTAFKVINLGRTNFATTNNENKIYIANLITNNIDDWNFIETSHIETSQKTSEKGISIHTAYYSKELSNSRIEESKVDIYEFTNQVSAKNELNKWSNAKGCGYVKEKISDTIICECFQNGIWWTSSNLLINMGGSPRTYGIYLDAYDLIVCSLDSGCESEYIAYASKAVFDAYIKKYPTN